MIRWYHRGITGDVGSNPRLHDVRIHVSSMPRPVMPRVSTVPLDATSSRAWRSLPSAPPLLLPLQRLRLPSAPNPRSSRATHRPVALSLAQ